MALSFCLGLLSCRATHHAKSEPTNARELSRHVLVIERASDGQMTHSWRPREAFLAEHPALALPREPQGRIVQVAFTRDCEGELEACEAMCLAGLEGPDWSHMSTGARRAHCFERCKQPYLDCNGLKELAEGNALEFHAAGNAVDWMKRNTEKLLAGTVVVIAGVAFVVVVGASGGGVLLLAPVIILASSDVSSGAHFLAVQR